MPTLAERVSEVLGISSAGELALLTAVERGLPVASLAGVARSVAPTDKSFAYRIVPRATLSRRRKAGGQADRSVRRLSPEQGSRLARVASVWAMAVDVWGGEDAARRFMFEPHGLIGNRKPIDVVLETELGRPLVEGILGRLKYGSAV